MRLVAYDLALDLVRSLRPTLAVVKRHHANLYKQMLDALTSIPLVMSGHGQRQLHLRHHAHPLEADDLEGAGALTSLLPRRVHVVRLPVFLSA